MQRQNRLLGLGLHRDGFHAWMSCCRPDCASVGDIVFASCHERFDQFAWHQFDLVAELSETACPVL